MGDKRLEIEVLNVFIDNSSEYISAINRADASSLVECVHRLKGAARSIGAEQLALIADEAEDEFQTQYANTIAIKEKYAPKLLRITSETIKELNAYLLLISQDN